MNGSDNVWALSANAVLFCVICQEEHVAEEVVVVRMPCGHCICLKGFHQLESTSCPCCRTTFESEIELPKVLIQIWEDKIHKWISEEVARQHEMDMENADIIRDALAEVMLPALSPPPQRRRHRPRRGSRFRRNQRRHTQFAPSAAETDFLGVD